MTTYLYHFCALRNSSRGDVNYYDGLVQYGGLINTEERFEAVRKQIRDQLRLHYEDNLTITSLTLLNPLPEV